MRHYLASPHFLLQCWHCLLSELLVSNTAGNRSKNLSHLLWGCVMELGVSSVVRNSNVPPQKAQCPGSRAAAWPMWGSEGCWPPFCTACMCSW